jgi:hypothetical protein
MKTKIFKISMVALLIFSVKSYGQIAPPPALMDSIYIHIENSLEITISNCNYLRIKEMFEKDLIQLSQILKQDTSLFENFESYSVDYVPQKKLSIKPTNKEERIIFEGNKLKRSIYRNQCHINSGNYYADIKFNDINCITDTSNLNLISRVLDSLPEKNRSAYSYHFRIANGQIKSLKNLDHKNGDMNVISLEFGAGAGVVKNQLTTDLSAKFALQFSKKGFWKNQYYISNNLFYLFDNSGKIQYNNFVNLGYRSNFSNDSKKTNWIGIELGYLTSRNGNYFDKNTFRLGVVWDIGRYMSISPSLYTSSNFNKVYPGIRLGIGF